MEQMQIKTDNKTDGKTDEKLYLTCQWCGSDSKFSFKIVKSKQMFSNEVIEVECDKCKETFVLIYTDFWRELRRRSHEQTTK